MHIVSRQQRRGAETVAIELAVEMKPYGIQGILIALGPASSGTQVPEIELLGRSSKIGGFRPILLALRLRRRITSWHPDVVLAHGGQATLVSVLATMGTGIPIVWQRILEFPVEVWRWPQKPIWSWVLRHVQSVIAITPRVGDEVRRLGFSGNVYLEPNHRRWKRFAALDRGSARARLRAELSIPTSARVVGFVGHMVDQKRPEMALSVFQGLTDLDVRCVFVGDGPLLPVLKDRIRTANLGGRIITLGHRNDVPEILAGLDVLVLTSHSETMTGTAIEAQMAGCPIASFALDGIETVILPEKTGLIVPMDDVSALIAATRALLEDPTPGDERANIARVHARQFGTDLAAARYAQILQSVGRL